MAVYWKGLGNIFGLGYAYPIPPRKCEAGYGRAETPNLSATVLYDTLLIVSLEMLRSYTTTLVHTVNNKVAVLYTYAYFLHLMAY